MDRAIEFLVDDFRVRDAQILVIGRLLQGPIVLQDVFTTLYRYVQASSMESFGRKPKIEPGSESSASLTLTYIEAYRASLLALDPGMTALLILKPERSTLFQRNTVIAGHSSRDVPDERILERLSAATPFV